MSHVSSRALEGGLFVFWSLFATSPAGTYANGFTLSVSSFFVFSIGVCATKVLLPEELQHHAGSLYYDLLFSLALVTAAHTRSKIQCQYVFFWDSDTIKIEKRGDLQ